MKTATCCRHAAARTSVSRPFSSATRCRTGFRGGSTRLAVRAESSEPDNRAPATADAPREPVDPLAGNNARKRQADSTDWMASTLSRRFGLAGGLAWVAFLAIGTLGEQVKTRLEVAQEEGNRVDVQDAPVQSLPGGVTYQTLRIGGGSSPQKGYLVVLDFKATANAEVFEDTRERGKPVVFSYGSRPFTGGMNAGVEQVLATMKVGGRVRCTVPPEMGFGDRPFAVRPTRHAGDKAGVVPPNSTLEYEIELLRVSIPPS